MTLANECEGSSRTNEGGFNSMVSESWGGEKGRKAGMMERKRADPTLKSRNDGGFLTTMMMRKMRRRG